MTRQVDWRLLSLVLLCTGWLLPAQASAAPSSVQALRYGTTLYAYFQQDYFHALTELMVAQQLGELGPHAETAELLRGGMNLSWGMDRSAQQIFTQILATPSVSPDHDKAWFYLGKLAWQRGQTQRAEQALTHLDEQAATPQATYLQAAISLRRGEIEQAASRARQLPGDSPWLYYLYYNLGGAQASREDWSSAAASFTAAATVPQRTAESQALRDRALSAAGFARLAGNDLHGAIDDFSHVRLDGPLAERALLGYGWALGQTGD